jgi:putative colanic acid biosynthesis glycosyltransferase
MLPPNAMSAAPPVSVIVVCRNPGDRLPRALASIWEQAPGTADVIVVDGGSTDGTRPWLEARRDRIHVLIAEPDHGVYDAMNKGVAAARTEWVLFLGADDRLAGREVLAGLAPRLARTAAGVVAGEAVYADGRRYRLRLPPNPIARNFVHHQAAFYRRRLLAADGGFDITLRIMADYEMNLRLWRRREQLESVPECIALCGVGGLSDRGHWRGYREEIAVRHRYFSPLASAPWDGLSLLRFGRKQIVRRLLRSHG